MCVKARGKCQQPTTSLPRPSFLPLHEGKGREGGGFTPRLGRGWRLLFTYLGIGDIWFIWGGWVLVGGWMGRVLLSGCGCGCYCCCGGGFVLGCLGLGLG
ncbi:hypothetical protein BO71DRAFT_98812 [Aspergillus ellipticus CBS 707.79]|uniref:Transmembrane protein n=1 Tax=Aspergillus ellipticus CBS 707.79 TaxID=1448320 RepID=A0A319CYY8_9EURO|nr:hypothetical protein BO71DRAFT_98812 [Aspergillus ellipticus CBS 707.79]